MDYPVTNGLVYDNVDITQMNIQAKKNYTER